MNVFVCLLTLAILDMGSAGTDVHPRGCVYAFGRCYRECEEGTRSYNTNCGHLTREATCEEPNPQPDMSSYVCDYSACYCEPHTVRDTKNKKCVPLTNCHKS